MTLISKNVYIDKVDHIINKQKQPFADVLQSGCS